ncbi:hypothetical protein [Nocardioides humi]|uniref:Uncharacterized protein n=1 Tax=Nocardioides humi TaxID=449461 RepID=A0ABN2BG52_9ACTN|nr:hypothetical protein [Nocardioides humi]
MILRLRTAPAPVLLVEEPAVMSALALLCDGADRAALGLALERQGAGSVADDEQHVWVRVAWVREQVAAVDPSLLGGFDGMVAYAAKHGWVDASGHHVRVHIAAPDIESNPTE